MARTSKLTEKQWADIQTRLLNGEVRRALAREYEISETAIRKRLSSQCEQIKVVANQVFAADQAFKALPISSQNFAASMIDDMKAMSMHMAGAGKFNSATSHRLAGIAHGQIDKIDDADPMESQEVLQGVAALLKLSNESAIIPLGLIKANADLMRDTPSNSAESRRLEPLADSDFLG